MGQSGRVLRGNKEDDGVDDVKRQVDSDDKYQKPIYQLVNVKNGGGSLIDIIKASTKSRSSSTSLTNTTKSDDYPTFMDKQIHDLVEPLLYNGGRGKLVPLSYIWKFRLGKSASNDKQSIDQPTNRLKSVGYRWVCWKLEERGFVGETALHICFLLSTTTHMILARKLLALFPMLINDIYTCDEYFGESSLHMAIVNENIRIVKLLLEHGANVHERCLGSFFLPMDQKDKANSQIRNILLECNQKFNSDTKLQQIDLQSNQLKGLATNYHGYAYWGEYPMSFAACLGLVDCFKLLLAKGANPNRRDSNGNSTLHMTVVADRIEMFDLCYASGADLTSKNNQGYSPLTLAAKLKRVNMFFHILTIVRQVDWTFCDVGFAEIPLCGIDSINDEDGSHDETSALAIVVFGGSSEHLMMLNGLLTQILMVKWATAARNRFQTWLWQYLTFMMISTIAYVTRFNRDQEKSQLNLFLGHTNRYCEYTLLIFVLYYLWVTFSRIVPKFSRSSLIKSVAQAPEISLFTITCLLYLICIPLRYYNLRAEEDVIVAWIMFTLPLKLLFFCRASKSVGPFVVMIYKILVNDILCFAVFLSIFIAGFSLCPRNNGSEFIDKNYFNNAFDGLLSMHSMALNEFGVVLEEFDSTDYSNLAKILFLLYMIICSILLVNLVIAMLGKTYQDIASQPNESLRQWARALLIVERLWSRGDRLRMFEKYSHQRISGRNYCRYYGLTWSLTTSDLVEISLSRELKSLNSKFSVRLGN